MNTKNHIAFLLSGILLINLTLGQIPRFFEVLTGKEVTIVHPFCKKAKNNAQHDSFKVNKASSGSFILSAICTTVIDFKLVAVKFFTGVDNFKDYIFKDSMRKNLFAKRFYIPPRV